ncbi:MAG: VOC family protein [Acidobacteria bacterium]|nr:VOC family protein [Acidobacteriota bacterium]
MPTCFNHTIIYSRSRQASAHFLTQILGLPEPRAFGHFFVVDLDNGVSLDFADAGGREFQPQHYAFLIDEADFDRIYRRIRERGLDHWADPGRRRLGFNRNDGGRAVYFEDPDGHLLEVLTKPYGSA